MSPNVWGRKHGPAMQSAMRPNRYQVTPSLNPNNATEASSCRSCVLQVQMTVGLSPARCVLQRDRRGLLCARAESGAGESAHRDWLRLRLERAGHQTLESKH